MDTYKEDNDSGDSDNSDQCEEKDIIPLNKDDKAKLDLAKSKGRKIRTTKFRPIDFFLSKEKEYLEKQDEKEKNKDKNSEEDSDSPDIDDVNIEEDELE